VHADDTPQQKPNVLFIISDALKPLLGCCGTSWIQSQDLLRSRLPDVVTVPLMRREYVLLHEAASPG
jgi:hypothetical protein